MEKDWEDLTETKSSFISIIYDSSDDAVDLHFTSDKENEFLASNNNRFSCKKSSYISVASNVDWMQYMWIMVSHKMPESKRDIGNV